MPPPLGYALKLTQHALQNRMEAGLRPLGLTLPQYAVLATLERAPGASNAALAKQAGATPQSMHGVVRNLEKAGLIARTPSPDHGRIQNANLTAKGTATLAEAHKVVSAVEALLRDAAAPLDYEEVVAMLERCRARLGG